MFENQKEESILNRIPHWPRICGFDGCQESTISALIEIKTEKGSRIVGAFSQFGSVKGNAWTLNDGLTFSRWICRCAEHYGK